MQRAIRESGNPPTHTQNHTAKRGYRQERYTGNDTYGFSAQMSSPWADKQSPSGENALEKQTAESKRLRSRKKQRFIFLFYHTKAGKATGRNANMKFVYTAGQAEKQSTVARLRILRLLPFQLKILRQKIVKNRRHNDNDVCQFVSNSNFELKKPTNQRRILQKIRHSFFRKKPAKTPDFRESPAKSPETPRKI